MQSLLVLCNEWQLWDCLCAILQLHGSDAQQVFASFCLISNAADITLVGELVL